MAPSTSHRADIQGLRALAVLLVVLAHAGVGLLPGGFVGVDVFFVLSGFLITGLLLAEVRATGTVSLIDFYVRRARRILPAAALTLLATDVAAFFLLNFLRAETSSRTASTQLRSRRTSGLQRGMDYFAQAEPPSPLLHYWSLAVEEQFYLVWPALISIVTFGLALARRRRRAGRPRGRPLLLVVVVLSGISFGWSVHLTTAMPAAAYFSPLTRAWELGLGCALAVGASTLMRTPPLARLVMGWGGLLAIVAAALLFSERTPFPGFAALLPTVGTALAIAAGIGDRHSRLAVARLLELRPLCIVGDRSYAFYLWHWPVLILADQYVGYELSVTVKLGLLAGAFLLSCVSYALVENPIRRRARGRRATGAVFGVSMAAVLGTAVLCLTAIARDEQRFNAPAASASLVTPAIRTSHSLEEASANARHRPCRRPRTAQSPWRALEPYGAVVVIGDSEGLREDPVDCLLSPHASMATCTTRWPPSTLQSYDRVAATTKRLGIGFIATRGFFCFERQCPAV